MEQITVSVRMIGCDHLDDIRLQTLSSGVACDSIFIQRSLDRASSSHVTRLRTFRPYLDEQGLSILKEILGEPHGLTDFRATVISV